MFELEVWQAPINDSQGNILPGAQITVFNSDDTVATIYDDLDRTPRSNPFTVGTDALARFYAEPGRYRVQAQSGSDIAVYDNVDLSQKAHRDDLADPDSEVLIAGRTAKDVSSLRDDLANPDGDSLIAGKLAKDIAALRDDLADTESEALIAGIPARNRVISVDSIQALRDLPASARRADVTVLLNRENGGGNVYWDSSLAHEDDAQVTFKPSSIGISDPGRWVAGAGFIIPGALTLNVGDEERFKSINACLNYLSNKKKLYQKTSASPQGDLLDGFFVQVLLKSGFVMREQVLLDGVDLGWIRIISEDAEVPVERSAITTELYDRFPLFCANHSATLPRISVLFNMDSSGDGANREGFFINNNGSVAFDFFAGLKNAGSRGLHVANMGRAVARACNFSGAGTFGVRVSNAGSVTFRDGVATGCGELGLAAGNAAIVNCDKADFSGSMGGGMNSIGARVYANGANFSNCAGEAARIRRASYVELNDADCSSSGGSALVVDTASTVNAEGINCSNSGDVSISASDCSVVNAIGSSCYGSSGIAIISVRSSTVNAQSSDARDSNGAMTCLARDASTINANGLDGTCGTGNLFQISRGSIINAHNSIGEFSEAPNVLTNRGVIFK